MKLCLFKVTNLDVCIRPSFANSVTIVVYCLQVFYCSLGVATVICKKLSETGVFEDAAFHLWKTTSSETVGHYTMMLALKDFYDWLESTPVESDYSQ